MYPGRMIIDVISVRHKSYHKTFFFGFFLAAMVVPAL